MPIHRLIGMRTLVVVLAFVLVELGLRLFTGYGRWTVTERDPRIGWRMIPNQSAASRDVSVPEYINSLGFRDRDWDAPMHAAGSTAWVKNDALVRVALVGNSMTYGTGVLIEQTFGRLLEQQLEAQLRLRGDTRHVLVMNFAVQGYVFEQMARTYEDSIRPFRPDVLVVATVPHDVVPFFGGPSENDFPYRRALVLTATHDFLLKRVMLPTKRVLEPHWRPDTATASAAALDAALSARPYAAEHEPYWDAMRARMADVRAMVESDGGHLAILNLPQFSVIARQSAKTSADVWNAWAAAQNPPSGEPSVLSVDPRIPFETAMARLLPAVRERGYKNAVVENVASGYSELDPKLPALGESLYLADDLGHYDPQGHRILAATLFKALVESGWLAPQ